MPRKRYGRYRRRNRTTYVGKRRYTKEVSGGKGETPRVVRSYGAVIVPKNCGSFNCFGLPSCLSTKLRYSARHSFAPTDLTPGYRQFRLNDLYDPDYTGVGGQPYGRDEIAPIFQKYQVMACKVTIMAALAYDGKPMMLTMRPSTQVAAPTDIDAESERSYSRSVVLTGGKAVKLKGYYRMYQILGMKKDQYIADEDTVPDVGSSPVLPVYLNIVAIDLGSDQTPELQYTVKFTFYARWMRLNDVAPS